MKKKILFIIALIMIISTIIRTVIVSYSFVNFSDSLIKNENELIKGILVKTKNKDEVLKFIKNSTYIRNIEKIPHPLEKKIIYNFGEQTITSYIECKDHFLKITYDAKEYYDNIKWAIFQLVNIALISLVLIILIVNYFLTPYLEILEKVKETTENILKGNFDNKIETKLKGEAKEFVESYNYFLNKIKESFGVIEEKYTSLIEKEAKADDPLTDAKETIEELANIFKFKRLIEEDELTEVIFNRLIEAIQKYEVYNFYIIGINNRDKESFMIYKTKDLCCDVEENFEHCRAYRLSKEVNSLKYEHICPKHMCESEYICIPFSASGNFTGILKIIIETEEEKEKVTKNLAYIKAYLNEVSSIIEAKYTLELLKEQTIKDPLTGLFNRRYLENILTLIIANAKRKNDKIGFLMIDMDYFKKVNDTYGHDAGDMILKQLGEILKESIRESDIAVRFGGEEFVIILQNLKDKKDLEKVAEKIRKNVEKYEFDTGGGSAIKKTVSIGGALFDTDCKKGWECIKYADLALYKAKNNGRNQVVIFDKKLKEESQYD